MRHEKIPTAPKKKPMKRKTKEHDADGVKATPPQINNHGEANKVDVFCCAVGSFGADGAATSQQ
jgi:hypothetical protein